MVKFASETVYESNSKSIESSVNNMMTCLHQLSVAVTLVATCSSVTPTDTVLVPVQANPLTNMRNSYQLEQGEPQATLLGTVTTAMKVMSFSSKHREGEAAISVDAILEEG